MGDHCCIVTKLNVMTSSWEINCEAFCDITQIRGAVCITSVASSQMHALLWAQPLLLSAGTALPHNLRQEPPTKHG